MILTTQNLRDLLDACKRNRAEACTVETGKPVLYRVASQWESAFGYTDSLPSEYVTLREAANLLHCYTSEHDQRAVDGHCHCQYCLAALKIVKTYR